MNHAAVASGDVRKRSLRRVSNVLVAVAVTAAVWPWATGIYTWYEQQVLNANLTRDFASARLHDPPVKDTGPWAGWAEEDAAYWKRLKDKGPVAKLWIPRIGERITVVKGASVEDLKLGPGWIPETDPMGPTGNTVISGHRTTYLAPFRNIDQLRRGDRIELESPFRLYRYEVYRQLIVKPTYVAILKTSKRPILTLTACHPPYTADARIIIQARLVRVYVLKNGH